MSIVLDKDKIMALLVLSLRRYIKSLEIESLNYLEYEGEVKAYLKVLNEEKLKCNFLDINAANKLLNIISDMGK